VLLLLSAKYSSSSVAIVTPWQYHSIYYKYSDLYYFVFTVYDNIQRASLILVIACVHHADAPYMEWMLLVLQCHHSNVKGVTAKENLELLIMWLGIDVLCELSGDRTDSKVNQLLVYRYISVVVCMI